MDKQRTHDGVFSLVIILVDKIILALIPIIRTVAIFLLFYSVSGCNRAMPDVNMRFVDEDSNQPITGVNVIFYAYVQRGTIAGGSGKQKNLFLVEAVSDGSGEIYIPAQEFWPAPFLLNTNYNNPSMIAFKEGYDLQSLYNTQNVFAGIQDVTSWEYNNKTIKMKRATTDKEIYDSLNWAAMLSSQAYRTGGDNICLWKNIPRFLVTQGRLATEWNYKRHLIEDEQLRRRLVGSPLENILANEKYYTREGCGSANSFFRPYIRTMK